MRGLFQQIELFLEDESNDYLIGVNGLCIAQHLLDFLNGGVDGDEMCNLIVQDMMDAMKREKDGYDETP